MREDTEKRFDSGYLDAACHIRYREMGFSSCLYRERIRGCRR